MTPDYLSAIEPEKRTSITNAIKICEGDPSKPGAQRKKAGGGFTDYEWANLWIHRYVRGKLKEAEQKKRTTEIADAQKAIDTAYPEE